MLKEAFENKEKIAQLRVVVSDLENKLEKYIDSHLIDCEYKDIPKYSAMKKKIFHPNFHNRPRIGRTDEAEMREMIKNGSDCEVQLFLEAPKRLIIFDEQLRRWSNYFMKVEILELTVTEVKVSCNVRDLSMAEGYGGTEIGNRTYWFNLDRKMVETWLNENKD